MAFRTPTLFHTLLTGVLVAHTSGASAAVQHEKIVFEVPTDFYRYNDPGDYYSGFYWVIPDQVALSVLDAAQSPPSITRGWILNWPTSRYVEQMPAELVRNSDGEAIAIGTDNDRGPSFYDPRGRLTTPGYTISLNSQPSYLDERLKYMLGFDIEPYFEPRFLDCYNKSLDETACYTLTVSYNVVEEYQEFAWIPENDPLQDKIFTFEYDDRDWGMLWETYGQQSIGGGTYVADIYFLRDTPGKGPSPSPVPLPASGTALAAAIAIARGLRSHRRSGWRSAL